MGLFPEKEPKTNVYERPDEASPLNIERKEVVTPTPTNFKAQVADDSGRPVIQTPQNQKIKIVIPSISKQELEEDAKGNIEDTHTWSASYWLRRILKAIHSGLEIMFGGNNG